MNIVLNYSERPGRSVTGQRQQRLAYWDHKPEAIIHPAGAALKRRFKCGILEGE